MLLATLFCFIFLKPAVIRQLTMCAFSGLWLPAFFFQARVCTCVCKCEFANVLWLCFSFWKFLWCACLFIYLCCVQAFSAVKATVDVLCAAQTAIHHSWTSLTAEPLTSSSQHPPFAATGTLLKSHRSSGVACTWTEISIWEDNGIFHWKCPNHFILLVIHFIPEMCRWIREYISKFKKKIIKCFIVININYHSKVVSYAHQGCIYLIKKVKYYYNLNNCSLL